MSGTTQAVKNAAAALKKAADPWNKEDRETAERIVSAAISLVSDHSTSNLCRSQEYLTLSYADRHNFSRSGSPGYAVRITAPSLR
jgi:hypothetical protein